MIAVNERRRFRLVGAFRLTEWQEAETQCIDWFFHLARTGVDAAIVARERAGVVTYAVFRHGKEWRMAPRPELFFEAERFSVVRATEGFKWETEASGIGISSQVNMGGTRRWITRPRATGEES